MTKLIKGHHERSTLNLAQQQLTLQDVEYLNHLTTKSDKAEFSPVQYHTPRQITIQLDIALKRRWIKPELINGPIPHQALLLLGRALDRIERLEVPRHAYEFIEMKIHTRTQCQSFEWLKARLEAEIVVFLRQVHVITEEYRAGLVTKFINQVK